MCPCVFPSVCTWRTYYAVSLCVSLSLYVENLLRCAPMWHIWFSLTNFGFYPSAIARVLQLTLFLVQSLGFLAVNLRGIDFFDNLLVFVGVSGLQVRRDTTDSHVCGGWYRCGVVWTVA